MKPIGSVSIREAVTLIIVFLIVIGVWYASWQWIDSRIANPTTADATTAAMRGQFGDQFGAVNSLFSGLAFAGIIFTLLLQKRDLRETREAMSHERFDNTFFQLLSVQIAITEKIEVIGGSGKKAFDAFNEHLKASDPDFYVFCGSQKLSRDQVRKIKDNKIVNTALYPELDDSDVTNLTESLKSGVKAFENYLDDNVTMHEKKIVDAYIRSASKYIDSFSHYFRNLYHLLKFIDESPLVSEIEKIRYSRFVRAQLSQVELVTLFYNSITPIQLPGREHMELGHPKMGRLLQKFDILQNMNPRSAIHPCHVEIFNNNNLQGR
jgi:hypothetical protein